MRYHNITVDMLNGDGLRVVLWLSHCDHKCKGCQNPQTADKNSGIPFDIGARNELMDKLNKDYIKGITFSGGDPLSTINRFEVLELIKEIKRNLPLKDIWLYTGYEWNDVKYLKGIENIDCLVDGKYEESLNFPSPKWCGSSNQNLVDVKVSLKTGELCKRL